MNQQEFISKIWNFYRANKRHFAWRDNPTPYYVFVSEVMLQQTQTFRIIDKFELFISHFPDFNTLAQAPFVDVLRCWKGLGYNRRAKFIQQAAQIICTKHDGVLPSLPEELVKLPGIGPATACSIPTFAFNKPTVFIETNIRAVFIHEYFPSQENITDAQLMPLIQSTVDIKNPRDWYYALMDYGVFLKKNHKNPSRKSKHHVKQSKFEGSNRQLRGKILEQLLLFKKCTAHELAGVCASTEDKIDSITQDLINENLIEFDNNSFRIK
ncbi:A/G-specific adenine glycosylase [Candidatus Dependentiae bacterium]|nr:A/G-specific adenine glycosylase [Candidatus Dependentiae bacterium]